jgi:ribulose-5-phosphate 4-epimerase/fuculose-1-phosphate aldolase
VTDSHHRPAHIGADEWAARVQLAAAYRIFDRMGWTELIYNHISLRVPDASGHILLNPFGLHYSEVCASNLVKVDARGNIVGDSDWPINPAGFAFHGAIHRARPEAHCVMHVHTTPTMAVCCLEEGLSFSNFYAAQLHGKVAYHDFEGITVHADEGERILASAAGQPVLLLRNHGPVVVGPGVAQAFSLLWLVQRACEVQLATMSMGAARRIATPVLEACVRDSLQYDPRFGGGQNAFDAMQRLVDAADASYRR